MITADKTKAKAIRELDRFYKIFNVTPNAESLKPIIKRLGDIHAETRLFPGLSVIQGRINTAHVLYKDAGNLA